jgi:hypothetical protein
MNRSSMPTQLKGKMKKKMMSAGGALKMVTNKQGDKVPFYAADGVGKMKKGGKVKGFKTGDAVKPPKSLVKAMVEAADDSKKEFLKRKDTPKNFMEFKRQYNKLPENVMKAVKKIVSRVPPKPPTEMPTSVRMNKMNRGKVQESLGKSVETGSDTYKKGGKVKKSSRPRGCGIAKKGVRKAKYI